MEALNAVQEAESSLEEVPPEEVLPEKAKSGLSFVVHEGCECGSTLINPSSDECPECERLLQFRPIEFGPNAHISDGVIHGRDPNGKEIKVEMFDRTSSRYWWNQEQEKVYYEQNAARHSDPFESWVSLRKEPEEKKAPWAVLIGDKVRARYLNKYDAVRLYDALRYAYEGNV